MGRLNDSLKSLGAKLIGTTPKGKQPSEIINDIATWYKIEVAGITSLDSAQCEHLPLGAVVVDTTGKKAYTVTSKGDTTLLLVCIWLDTATLKVNRITYTKSGTWSAGSVVTSTFTVS